jgi:hypothetical protein
MYCAQELIQITNNVSFLHCGHFQVKGAETCVCGSSGVLTNFPDERRHKNKQSFSSITLGHTGDPHTAVYPVALNNPPVVLKIQQPIASTLLDTPSHCQQQQQQERICVHLASPMHSSANCLSSTNSSDVALSFSAEKGSMERPCTIVHCPSLQVTGKL